MTRYDKELRRMGFKLEHDYECLPWNGIETVETGIVPDGILIASYHVGGGWVHTTIHRDGSMSDN